MATALRTKARTLDPEVFDPGQPVEHQDVRGVIWCLGPENGARKDSRWVVCEDGTARVLVFSKASKAAGLGLTPSYWAHEYDYTPKGARPFDLDAWKSTGEPPMPEELPGMPEELATVGGRVTLPVADALAVSAEAFERTGILLGVESVEPEQPAQDSRCGSCKGFGLVRASGKRYRFRENAEQAQRDGRAVACPDCTTQAA